MSEAIFQGWTAEIVSDVTRRYHAGETPSDIARSYGITRNQVNAKLDRMGELRRRGPATPVSVAGRVLKAPATKPARMAQTNLAKGQVQRIAKARAQPKAVIAGNNTIMLCPQGEPPKRVVEPEAFKPLAGSTPRDWGTRKFSECSWPVTDADGDLKSCCLAVHKRGWCKAHFLAGTVPPKAKQQQDAQIRRTARRYA